MSRTAWLGERMGPVALAAGCLAGANTFKSSLVAGEVSIRGDGATGWFAEDRTAADPLANQGVGAGDPLADRGAGAVPVTLSELDRIGTP